MHSGKVRGRRAASVIAMVIVAAMLAGCAVGGGSSGGSTGGKPNVVTTTTQIRSMTEAVAGDLASVRSILTPGADAHHFEPRPSDVATIATSTLVLKNGLALDDWVEKLINNAGGQRPIVTVSTGITPRR